MGRVSSLPSFGRYIETCSNHGTRLCPPHRLALTKIFYIPERLYIRHIRTRYHLRIFDQDGHQTTSAYIENKHFFTKSCHCKTYQNYEQPPRTSQNSYFLSHFSVLKIGWIFPKKKFNEEYSTRRPTFIKKCFWKFWFLRYFIF